MNPTLLTIVSIALMIVSCGYFLIYTKKKKTNTQGDIGYKLVFSSIILLLVIPIVFSAI